MTMLYRGQSPARAADVAACQSLDRLRDNEVVQGIVAASGRWFTDDIETARWYAESDVDAEIVCVEISDYVADAFRVSNIDGPLSCGCDPMRFSRDPEREFMLPRHIAERAVRVESVPRALTAMAA